MISLRTRLLVLTVALLAAGLAISDTLVIGSLRGNLVRRVDDLLKPLSQAAGHLSPSLFTTLGDRSAINLDLVPDIRIAYLAADGSIQQTTAPGVPRLDAKAVAARGGRPFEEHGWRVIALPRAGGSVVVAGSLGQVDATIGRLRRTCLLISAAVLALLAGVGWFAVRAGLRPLRQVEETAAGIADGDLARRVPGPARPNTEIGRLSAALNGMLAQIEAGVTARAESEARMRRFVADAGHELRTPLAGIKGFTELYRLGGVTDLDRTMGRIESESARLTRLVEDLLLLSRPTEVRLTPMDLRTLAADALHDLRALDPSRPVRLGVGTGDGEAPVLGDEERLRQVVTNLIGNVVAHTPRGTPVRIGVGTEDGQAVLEVEDQGPGMTEEQASRVFERFYRVDASRSRQTGGSGLGLSIAASLVAAHGGRIDVRTAPGEGACFRLLLPVREGGGE